MGFSQMLFIVHWEELGAGGVEEVQREATKHYTWSILLSLSLHLFAIHYHETSLFSVQRAVLLKAIKLEKRSSEPLIREWKILKEVLQVNLIRMRETV